MNRNSFIHWLVFGTFFLQNFAMAQATDPDVRPPGTRSDVLRPKTLPETLDETLDEIQVTAQKRKQPIQEVPISMQILDGVEIEKQRLSDTTDLAGQIANVQISKNTAEGTTPAITLRGVGNLDYNTSTTSPIGVYVDGVGGGTQNRHLANLYDVESVEVLRGPQGTLFGRNSTGGALLINTRRPDPYLAGYVRLGLGDDDRRQVAGAVNLPLSEVWATRLAFDDQRYAYTVKNLHAPAPEPRMHQSEARWSFAGDFDDLQIYAKLHGERWSGVASPVRHIGVIAQRATATTPAVMCSPAQAGSNRCTDVLGFTVGSNDLNVVSVNSESNGGSPHRRDSHGLTVQLEYALSEQSYLTSITSYSRLDRIHFYNADASPAQILEGNLQVDGAMYSQELRYHRQFDSAYFIAGLYALDEPLTQDFFVDTFRDFRAQANRFSNAAKIVYDNAIDTQSQAAFANLDLPLSDRNTLTAGLRYTREQLDYQALGVFNVAAQVNDFVGVNRPGWDVVGEVKDANWSGKLALNQRWSDQFNTWISAARGFKSGGYNGGIAFSAEEAERNEYGSEHLNALEVGGNWLLSDVALQFSAFYYDYQDQQVFMNTESINNGPPLQLLDNVGESTIFGAEFELDWQVSEQFNARFGAGWLPKAELAEFTTVGGRVVKDSRLPFTPRWNVNSTLTYLQPLSSGELQWQLQGNYQSQIYFDQNQNPYTEQKSFGVLNARISYERDQWSAGIWAKNLTNASYSNLRFDLINFLGLVQDHRGAQRQMGVDWQFRF